MSTTTVVQSPDESAYNQQLESEIGELQRLIELERKEMLSLRQSLRCKRQTDKVIKRQQRATRKRWKPFWDHHEKERRRSMLHLLPQKFTPVLDDKGEPVVGEDGKDVMKPLPREVDTNKGKLPMELKYKQVFFKPKKESVWHARLWVPRGEKRPLLSKAAIDKSLTVRGRGGFVGAICGDFGTADDDDDNGGWTDERQVTARVRTTQSGFREAPEGEDEL